MQSIDLGFQFDNSFLQLPTSLYSLVNPSKAPSPSTVIYNSELADQLGLNKHQDPNQQAAFFCGNFLHPAGGYYSQAYAGHQFGHFTILGDGRAIMLGEHITPEGKRFDLQFKGAGPTPYSRQGDGRAALGPMLREYLISEAMHGLTIPTSRSLAVVSTGDAIHREQKLPGAVLTRVSSSHLRVGSFEFASRLQDPTVLKQLLNYTIQRHYPECLDSDSPALSLLQSVMQRQIETVIGWMRVGFIHGVMNTDNMTISGETIDYGPCAFIDTYNPNTVFSSIDHNGRYAFCNQPNIAQWNLAVFAEALLPLIHSDQKQAISRAEAVINQFPKSYQDQWLSMMRMKIGLFDAHPEDQSLIEDLCHLLKTHHCDYTNTFRQLAHIADASTEEHSLTHLAPWIKRWMHRLEHNKQPVDDAIRLMNQVNPYLIARNHQVERVLQAAYLGDLEPLHYLSSALKTPYEFSEVHAELTVAPEPSERVYQTYCGT